MGNDYLIELKNVTKIYDGKKIIDDLSFQIEKGARVGIVGRSGGGKSTLAKIMTKLIPCDEGQILYKGQDITGINRKVMRGIRPKLQMVFQDYRQALDNHMQVGKLIEEPLDAKVYPEGVSNYARGILTKCGLSTDVYQKHPHHLSGGQAQRVCLARALAVNPELLIMDESTSALDGETAGEILSMIKEFDEKREMAIVLISHDLTLIQEHCTRVFNLDEASTGQGETSAFNLL